MYNKAMLIGRLGADPDSRFLPDGTPVSTIRLATDETWKGDDGETKKRTEWHRIVFFGKLAEICGNYLSKGRLVHVEGRIQTRSWEDKDGIKRFTTEIIGREMKMLDSSKREEAPHPAEAAHTEGSPVGEGPLPDQDVPF